MSAPTAYLVTFTDKTTMAVLDTQLAERFKDLGHRVEPLAKAGTLTEEQRRTVREVMAYLRGQRGPDAYGHLMSLLDQMARA